MPEEQPSLPVLYTNIVRITYNLYDFSILMGVSEPSVNPPPGGKKAQALRVQAVARVVMSPPHFKKFLEVGARMLEGYEKEYGEVASGKRSKA